MTPPRVFSRTRKIRFSHCDPAGILYFPQVFDFVNAAVEDWFETGLGMPFDAFHMEHGLGNPVVRTECEFLRPCRFGEELVLELAPTHIGRSSMELRIVARVADEERMRLRHRTAMISLDGFHPIAIPDALRARALEFLADAAPRAVPRSVQASRAAAAQSFRSRQLVRYAHCDPGGIVYFARFFDMLDAVLEDWFAGPLGAPWGRDFVGVRDLRTPSLFISCEFLRACRLGEEIEFELGVRRLGRSSIELALCGRVEGEERMRADWSLCVVSHRIWKSVPIPDDLRTRMQAFIGQRG